MSGVRLAGLDLAIKDAVREVLREELALLSPQSSGDADTWLSVQEAAKYSGFAPTSLRQWCREGRLDAGQVGGHWRIRRSSLDRAIRTGATSLRSSDGDLVESEADRILSLEAHRRRG